MDTNEQSAITQALAGDFKTINNLELHNLLLNRIRPHTVDEDGWGDEEGQWDNTADFSVVGTILSPTGRAIGLIWTAPCHKCEGDKYLVDEDDNEVPCDECEDTGLSCDDADEIRTDFNGVMVEKVDHSSQIPIFEFSVDYFNRRPLPGVSPC